MTASLPPVRRAPPARSPDAIMRDAIEQITAYARAPGDDPDRAFDRVQAIAESAKHRAGRAGRLLPRCLLQSRRIW
jgi:hypothetical protein